MAATVALEESANDRSYRFVRDGIVEGRFVGGMMLSEASLAGELGVSRTPVRAALARLQEEGWLRIYPKRGALVQTLGERAISELAEMKVMLESGAVEAASPPVLIELAGQLRPELDRQREALTARDVGAFVELSISFHRSFAAAAGNTVLLELYDRLVDRQRFLLFSYGQQLLDQSAEIIDEHQAMIEAIATGTADTFGHTLRAHLLNTYRNRAQP